MIEILHAGRHLDLVREGRWEFARRRTASAVVAIVALTPADELLLVEQHRVPVNSAVIELPAGLVGDDDVGEDLLVAANRELDEETGWSAAQLRVLGRAPSSAGLTSEVVTLVRATGLTRTGTGGGVPGEGITVHAVPLSRVKTWLAARVQVGQLIDFKIYAGLWWLGQERLP